MKEKLYKIQINQNQQQPLKIKRSINQMNKNKIL